MAARKPKATAQAVIAEPEVGRPTKLTSEVQRSIVALLRAGNTRRAAAEASGISETRFYDWMQRGKSEEEWESEFREFREAVSRAESECEALMVESIRKAARGYDKKTTRTKTKRYIQELNGTDGKPIAGKDGQAATATVTETETVEIVGFVFHPAIAMEWLKRRRPDDWSERIETTGANGGPIAISSPAMDAATNKLNKWREDMMKRLEASPN